MKEPLLSVIVPVYNTAPYLERCLNSIINQTYKNLEIILVDDGSTDASGKICDEYAAQDSRFKLVHKKNEGVAIARNIAISIASGDFLGFIDSDDYVSPQYFEKLYSAFTDDTIDMVTCGFYYAYDNKIEQILNKKKVPDLPLELDDMFQYMYERDVYRGVAGYLWTRLTRMSLVKKNGQQTLLFHPDLDTTDDIVFVAELMCRVNKVKYLDTPLYYYCQRANSIVHDSTKNLESLVWLKSWEEALSVYTKNGVSEKNLNYIKRIYVYRCGKLLEIAKRIDDKAKVNLLKNKLTPFLPLYEYMNKNNPKYISWIHDLLYN